MKMKKFINAPETITDEELIGLGLAYPDILDVDGHLVISKDLAGLPSSPTAAPATSPPKPGLWAGGCWTSRRWAISLPPPMASWCSTP